MTVLVAAVALNLLTILPFFQALMTDPLAV